MCMFLAIHLAIIYNIGRIKFEKKLESSKDIAHQILDKFHSIDHTTYRKNDNHEKCAGIAYV